MGAFIIIVLIIGGLFWFFKYKNQQNNKKEEEGLETILLEITSDLIATISKYKSIVMPKILSKAQLNHNPDKKQVMIEMGNSGEINDIVMPIIQEVLKSDIDRLSYKIFSLGMVNSKFRIEDTETDVFKINSITIRSTLHFGIGNEFRRMNILQYDESQLQRFIIRNANFVTDQLNKSYDKINN